MGRQTIGKRLQMLSDRLSDDEFLQSRGLGNEIGYHIFAFDPRDTSIVEGYVPKLKDELEKKGIDVLEVSLYGLVLELLESSGLLQKAFKMEEQSGSEVLERELLRMVHPEAIVELIVKHMDAPHHILFITGVGSAYPLLRSHSILNNLHAKTDTTPVVMFFPGSYDGGALRLFKLLEDDNYYRAFPLVPEREGNAQQ